MTTVDRLIQEELSQPVADDARRQETAKETREELPAWCREVLRAVGEKS